MKKDNYWQMVRGICILFVILIHILYTNNSMSTEYFNIFVRRIINFATAVFIFMSGYFSKCDNTKEFYKKKLSRLVMPLVIWNLIYLFLLLFNDEVSIISLLKSFLLVKTAPHLYYIIVLLQLFLLCPLIIKYINHTKNNIFLYIPLLITPLYVVFTTLFNVIFHKNFILYNYWLFGWISYYYLGLLIRNKETHDISIRKYNFFIPIICLSFSILEGIVLKYFFNLYDLAISQLTLSNSIYSITMCLFIYSNRNHDFSSKLLYNIGNYSFGIYLSHILFIKIFRKINSLISLKYYTSIILIFIITVAFVYVFNKLYYERIKHSYDRNNR